MGKNKKSNNKLKEKTSPLKINSQSSVWQMSHAPSLDKGYNWFHMVPVIVFTAIIIMIVYMKTFNAPLEGYYWHRDKTTFTDFFSYYKSLYIILMAVLAAVIMLYRATTQSLVIKKTKFYIPLLIYGVFIFLSWTLSDYSYFAYHGFTERFEGVWVLLSYVFMTFYIINTINTERNIKMVIYAVGVSSSLLGLIGISQFLKHDLFQTTFGKKLITPNYYVDSIDKLKFNFTKGEIYQTVYNINYVSFYLTLLIPIFGFLFITEKKLAKKFIYAGITGLLLLNLFGAKSSGGLLGLGVAFILALILLNKKLLKWWKSIVLILSVVLIVFIAGYNMIMPEITSAIKSSSSTDKELVKKQFIDYFDTDYNTLTVSCNNEPLSFKFNLKDPSQLSVKDKNNNVIHVSRQEDNSYTLNDSRFDMYTLKFTSENSKNYIILYVEKSKWIFEITEDGIFFYNGLKKLVDLDPIPGIGFSNQLKFGSGRGLIWSRSLPLIKNHIFVGSGPDTYIFEFPQNDYAAKYNADWPIYNIVDKPHNMYLQIAINTGLISLISILALFIGYIIWSFRLYWKSEFEDFTSIVGVGIFLGICGFLTAALVNDSTVSVAPMFWGLLGMGIAINLKLDGEAKV